VVGGVLRFGAKDRSISDLKIEFVSVHRRRWLYPFHRIGPNHITVCRPDSAGDRAIGGIGNQPHHLVQPRFEDVEVEETGGIAGDGFDQGTRCRIAAVAAIQVQGDAGQLLRFVSRQAQIGDAAEAPDRELEDGQHGVMIAGVGTGGEVGIDMDDVCGEEVVLGQVGADQQVVELLRVAVVDEAVAVGTGQSLDHVGQHPTFKSGQRRREVEVVEVAQDNDVGFGVAGQYLVGKVVDDLRLGYALNLGGEHRRLHTPKQRVIPTFGFEVVDDDEDGLAIEAEFGCQ